MTPVFKSGDRVRVKDRAVDIRHVGKLGTVCRGPDEYWVWILLEGAGTLQAFRDRELEPAPASSPDTPEAGAAGERDGLRQEIERHLNSLPLPIWSSAGGIADALLPIIDRHTAKALETGLRERDEARQRAKWHSDVLDAGINEIDRLTAALSSEQSAHAETRKALEETEDFLDHLTAIAHHI